MSVIMRGLRIVSKFSGVESQILPFDYEGGSVL